MSRLNRRIRDCIVLATVLCFMQVSLPLLFADTSPVKMVKLEANIDETGSGPTYQFSLTGVASHLGKFTGVGEVAFVPGPLPDSEIGTGVVVLYATNGDQLVGVVTWDITGSEDDTHFANVHFSWRDSVTFSDGAVAKTTGRFVRNRPPGLVVLTRCIRVYNPITGEYVCVWVLVTR